MLETTASILLLKLFLYLCCQILIHAVKLSYKFCLSSFPQDLIEATLNIKEESIPEASVDQLLEGQSLLGNGLTPSSSGILEVKGSRLLILHF